MCFGSPRCWYIIIAIFISIFYSIKGAFTQYLNPNLIDATYRYLVMIHQALLELICSILGFYALYLVYIYIDDIHISNSSEVMYIIFLSVCGFVGASGHLAYWIQSGMDIIISLIKKKLS